MLWLLGPMVGIVVAIAGLQWALRSHRRERQPWLALLAMRGVDAARSGGMGALDGVASDGGTIGPMTAPFSGRPCVGFHIEIITQEQFGNRTTWQRVFGDGAGRFFLVGPEGPCGAVDLHGGGPVFPPSLHEYTKLSLVATPETVFQGPPDRTPPHLVGFVQQLSPDVQQLIVRPSGQLIGGKRLYFNERIVVPGQNVVVTGQCEFGPSGIHVGPSATNGSPVAFAHGNIASERARVAKLPVAGELVGAIMGGIVVCAVIETVVSTFSGR